MHTQAKIQRYRRDVDRYQRMMTAGIFDEDDGVDLVAGEFTAMVSPKPAHAEYVDRLRQAPRSVSDLRLRIRRPITLAQHSEPQPNLAPVTAKS